jgi:hypothetical protein
MKKKADAEETKEKDSGTENVTNKGSEKAKVLKI